MLQPLSPSAAGELLGVSRATVRRYADTFADILPDYDPQPGVRRTLTYDDLLYLWAIMQLQKEQPEGTSRTDILDMIQAPDFSGLVIPDRLPTEEDQQVAAADLPAVAGQADLVPALQEALSSFRDIATELRLARLEVAQEVDDLGRKSEETDRQAQAGFNELHARMISIETKQAQAETETRCLTD